MRAGARLLRWGSAALALLLAHDPHTPYLLAVRGVIVPALVVAGVLGAAWAGRAACRRRLGWREAAVLAAAGITVATLALADAHRFAAARLEVLAAGASDPQLRRLGAHFMIGYRDADEVAALAARGLIGGIYLGRHNVRGRSVEAVRAEIDRLQALRARNALPPLIVAADQEGGSVAHMSPPLAPQPALASVLAGDEAGLEARARDYGRLQGAGLAALGVTLNFGPVVDLRPAHGGPLFDTHTRIGERAIDGDPARVARVARAYAEGLADAGVQATLKHFPGLGGVMRDTHHFAARLDTPGAVLAAHDWQAFRGAAPASAAMMVGHVVLPELDADRPASLSPAVVQGLLRRGWGYQGLLVTDDLNMGAVYRRGTCRAAVEALEAGIDLVLISYDPAQFYRALLCARRAFDEGRLQPELLAAGRSRLAAAAHLSTAAGGQAVREMWTQAASP
ncbi:putative beta-hexosaminidase [Azoarcus olearius]|uniref:glycoside hydrolase family 3 N-terminal domain-containing protein n=1 Tax=Azoarcus sp. (strain BH72) TaxID=418699 RepID=UPI0008063F68|nr:glycoside hydrolase family 3 N-terminal domain-containing protein [Azoarcus olearius]ANQ83845.1 putative beta-hexosaminidase [Azoarcus olearius]